MKNTFSFAKQQPNYLYGKIQIHAQRAEIEKPQKAQGGRGIGLASKSYFS